MPSHVALLVVIIFAKNGQSCSYGQAKYNLSKEGSQVIRWKYFFSPNEQPKVFTGGDLVLFSGKFIVENSEQCIAVTYSSTLDTGNPNHEFDITGVSPCIPHCMFLAVVN